MGLLQLNNRGRWARSLTLNNEALEVLKPRLPTKNRNSCYVKKRNRVQHYDYEKRRKEFKVSGNQHRPL